MLESSWTQPPWRRGSCWRGPCGHAPGARGCCCGRTASPSQLVLASVSLLVDFKLDLQIPTHTNVATLCGTLLGCLRSLQLSLCARKKVCACDAANWQWSMTAGAVAWALLAWSVLTQLWCACPSRSCPRWLVYLGSSRHEAPVHGGAVTGRCWSCAVCTVSCGTFRHTGTGTPRRAGIWCDSETVVAGCNTLVCRAWSSDSLWPMNVPNTVVLCGIGHYRDRA